VVTRGSQAEPSPNLGLRRVRPAYEQVADQLRALIASGVLQPGSRLPAEPALAKDLGVSRTTTREALRALAGEGLIKTSKGTTGGSFVIQPDPDRVVRLLSTSLAMGTNGDDVTLDDFMQVRRFLEVPAAGLAAQRRSAEDLQRLDVTLDAPLGHEQDQLLRNQDFHATLADICHNRLLAMAAQPIFQVLQTRLDRSILPKGFHRTVATHHRNISAAIAEKDAAAAERLMGQHLEWLVPRYNRAWVG
jgi:GntR family transcriptional repressor for pyruvate dehydrogenase complex